MATDPSLLRIPSGAQAGLSLLVGLTQAQFEAVEAGLTKVSAALSIEEVTSVVQSASGSPEGDAEQLAYALMNLYSLRERTDRPPGTFVDSVVAATRRSSAKPLQLSDEQASTLRERLERLLGLAGHLATTAKALEILYEQERLFSGARIITDLRPLWSGSPADNPSVAVLFHTLRVEYLDRKDDQPKSFRVALDSQDMAELRRVLDRAIEKEQALRRTADTVGLRVLRSPNPDGSSR